MATRSEIGAKIAGGLVAALSLGVLLYKALGPLLVGEDPMTIAGLAAGIVTLIVFTAVALTRARRRQMARRIKRR